MSVSLDTVLDLVLTNPPESGETARTYNARMDAKLVDMTKRNVWGDDIADVDTVEFTSCCEHPHGGHYTNCPNHVSFVLTNLGG